MAPAIHTARLRSDALLCSKHVLLALTLTSHGMPYSRFNADIIYRTPRNGVKRSALQVTVFHHLPISTNPAREYADIFVMQALRAVNTAPNLSFIYQHIAMYLTSESVSNVVD